MRLNLSYICYLLLYEIKYLIIVTIYV